MAPEAKITSHIEFKAARESKAQEEADRVLQEGLSPADRIRAAKLILIEQNPVSSDPEAVAREVFSGELRYGFAPVTDEPESAKANRPANIKNLPRR